MTTRIKGSAIKEAITDPYLNNNVEPVYQNGNGLSSSFIPYDYAYSYLINGLSVIPIRTDGTKKPAIDWKKDQTRRPSDDELMEWFYERNDRGIGIVCGAISENLELIDVDAPAVLTELIELVKEADPTLPPKLTVI